MTCYLLGNTGVDGKGRPALSKTKPAANRVGAGEKAIVKIRSMGTNGGVGWNLNRPGDGVTLAITKIEQKGLNLRDWIRVKLLGVIITYL